MKSLFKILLTVFASAVIMCALAVTASAESGTSGSTKWELSNGVLTVSGAETGGTGTMENYASRDKAPWYSNRTSITSVIISEGVENVSQYGFYGYSNIKSITLPSTLKKIGAYAFSLNTGLTNVTIPVKVNKIGYAAFNECSNLTTLYYNAKSCETLEGSESYLVFGSCSKLKNIIIGDQVQNIPDYIFALTEIETVTLPESVRKIGKSAFQNCDLLKTVNVSEKLYSIGDKAFKGCSALSSFTLPELVTSIGEEAFAGCNSLKRMDVSYHVTQIGTDAFADSSITVFTTTDAYAAKHCELLGVSYIATEASYGNIGSSTELMVNTNTSLSVLNGKLVIYVNFDKTLTDECVHVAFYNSSNKVVDYLIVPVTRSNDHMNIVMNDVSSAAYAKVFVWDSLESLCPISPIETVIINRP